MAKLAIFDTDMLWESCLKFHLEQHSHSMSEANIARLASYYALRSTRNVRVKVNDSRQFWSSPVQSDGLVWFKAKIK